MRCQAKLSQEGQERRRQLGRFGPLASLLPQPTQAHGSPQLQRPRLLAGGDGEGLLEAGFGLGRTWGGPAQHLLEVTAPRLLPGAAQHGQE